MNAFWGKKKVLITGHTGFKGVWLSLVLKGFGAKIAGYSLKPRDIDRFYKQIKDKKIYEYEIFADISDKKKLKNIFKKFKPDIVFHLAAQPLVIDSLKNPFLTYQTNVMGTLNILEMVKQFETKASVFVTTDKCYKNLELKRGYKETDIIGGKDIYSSSKACCEILIKSFRETYSYKKKINSIVSVRAGNVIGGGDFNKNRIIPDYFKALSQKKTLIIRNPKSVRPWQYILDVINGYLLVAERTFKNKGIFFDSWNFGPNEKKLIDVNNLIKMINRDKIKIIMKKNSSKIETRTLVLNSSRARKELNWKPKFTIEELISESRSWYDLFYKDKSKIYDLTKIQIQNYYK